MGSLKIKTGVSPIHTNQANKEQSPERIKNTSFIHSLKTVKNTVFQSIISIYHKLRFMLKQKLAKIEIVENPAYIKNTTANLLVPINSQLTDCSVKLPLKQDDTPSLQEKNKIKNSLSPQPQTQRINLDTQKKTITTEEANSIYLKNIELINQYADIPNDKKTDFNAMNKVIIALLSNPEYIKQEGIFRINGVCSKISDLLAKLSANANLDQLLSKDDSLTRNELIGAIKALRNKIITEHPKEKNKLNELISTYKESISQENATKKYVANMDLEKRNKILQIAANNADGRLPSQQELPLYLQICMPLFVEIANHSEENRMEPMQIATSFGGGLGSAQRTSAEENEFNKLEKEQQIAFMVKEQQIAFMVKEQDHVKLANEFLMKLINRELK